MSNLKTVISNCDLCREIVGEIIFAGQIISSKCGECKRTVCRKCVGCLSSQNTICRYCFFAEYDFNVYKNLDELTGRDFVEIGPGRYIRSWNQGDIFIKDDSFWLLYRIIKKFLPSYFPYGSNHMSSTVALEMVSFINGLIESDDGKLQKEIDESEIVFNAYKKDIIKMIEDICNSLVVFCNQSEWIRIIGI